MIGHICGTNRSEEFLVSHSLVKTATCLEGVGTLQLKHATEGFADFGLSLTQEHESE